MWKDEDNDNKDNNKNVKRWRPWQQSSTQTTDRSEKLIWALNSGEIKKTKSVPGDENPIFECKIRDMISEVNQLYLHV